MQLDQTFCLNKPDFLYSIKEPDQIIEWTAQNQQIVGLGMVGRSNVGKSSLINSLFGAKTARTSKTPGRTREILIFKFQLYQTKEEREQNPLPPFYLFDLPGYGHAEVSKEISKNWKELIPTFFSRLSPQVLIVNIQDARHPNGSIDKEFQKFIKEFYLGSYLVFNKMDKLKTQKERSALEKMKIPLMKECKYFKQIYFVSAEKGQGLQELSLGLKSYMLSKVAKLS